jgi:hypothetical protein
MGKQEFWERRLNYHVLLTFWPFLFHCFLYSLCSLLDYV